jgi:hypothetical protein
VEKIFGNRQFPILCAVDGTDFGQSAEKAESLSPRNVARLKTITAILFFIGQLVIGNAVGIGCFYILIHLRSFSSCSINLKKSLM